MVVKFGFISFDYKNSCNKISFCVLLFLLFIAFILSVTLMKLHILQKNQCLKQDHYHDILVAISGVFVAVFVSVVVCIVICGSAYSIFNRNLKNGIECDEALVLFEGYLSNSENYVNSKSFISNFLSHKSCVKLLYDQHNGDNAPPVQGCMTEDEYLKQLNCGNSPVQGCMTEDEYLKQLNCGNSPVQGCMTEDYFCEKCKSDRFKCECLNSYCFENGVS